MESTVSVSKGCFAFKPKEAKKGKRKNPSIALDFSSEIWYQSFRKLWKLVEIKLQEINYSISEIVLHDLEQFISACDTKSKTISSAALLLGVNLPDHSALFRTLASRLQASQTPHIAILQSDDCATVRNAIEKIVSQFLRGTKFEDGDAMEVDYLDSDSDDEDMKSVKKADCNLPALAAWYSEQYKGSNRPKLIVMLTDFEGFSSKVLEDFILILSQYVGRLPIVLIMGVATTASALHRSLPHTVTSQLSLRLFQSKPSVYFLNNTLDNVFLKGDCPFQLGSKVMKFLTDVFLFYDFSVDGFIKGIKYCVMEHFYGSNITVLCCPKSEIKNVVQSLEKEQVDSLKKLPSWQTYLGTLPKENRAKMNSLTKDTLKNLLYKLWEHISSFYIFLRLLHILVADLPNAPLGKQIRELYSEAVSVKVMNSASYKECFKILGFTAKDELLSKLDSMLDVLEKAPTKGEKDSEIFTKLKKHREDIYGVGLEPLNRTPSKSPSKSKFNITSRAQFREHLEKLSETKKPTNAYEAARQKLLDYLKDEVFEVTLVPLTSVPLHEVLLFDNIGMVKRHLIGSPRASLHTALNNPHHYLQCDCCKLSSDGEILPTMPDICIAYKLHLESGSLINMYDWLQSFASVINPDGEAVGKGEKELDEQIQARFTQAVAELQFLGFIKSSKKKTDHVTRLTWGGST